MNPLTGRFMSRDPEDGSLTNPVTLHKYLYGNGDPVNQIDPTGRAGTATTANAGGGFEYAGLVISISLGAVKAVAAFGNQVTCSLNDVDSDVEAISIRLEIAALNAFEWITPNKPPGGFGGGGAPLPPGMPPGGDLGPSGGSCSRCNCAIRCSVRTQSGAGTGGYSLPQVTGAPMR